ncbi:hypothetical protein F4678DRAFT_276736 [Xylaria arbuscula]|nr:hypothetical protein F4678DRAFT_276736 [Xylaria arbuscula]
MASKFKYQPLRPRPARLTLTTRPQASQTPGLTRNRQRDATSELQRKLSIVIKRVTGGSPPASTRFSSLATSEDDYTSDYSSDPEEEEEEEIEPKPSPFIPQSPVLSPTSYTSLSLNPYSIPTSDLAQHLSPGFSRSSIVEETETKTKTGRKVGKKAGTEIENKQKQDSARLARQLDIDHAAVVEEECAALRVLRQQARLGSARVG